MKQHVKEFNNYDEHLENILNDFLKSHPNYLIDKIVHLGHRFDKDRILVVFSIKENG